MSKPSRRANRQGILELRKQKKKADKKLRQAQKGQATPGAAISNGKSRLKDVAQESRARQQAVSEQVRIFRNQLPVLKSVYRGLKIHEMRKRPSIN